jgi:ATP/maltotriose-dependent transcriptional regulator MalT
MTSADRDFPLKTRLTEMVNSELADQLTGCFGSRRVLEGLFESGVFTVDSDRIGVEHRPADRERSGPYLFIGKRNTLR